VGSGLTWTGSLANLLWRRIQVRAGQPPSSRAFHRYSLLVTPPAVAVAVVVVWGWDRLLTR
jgi:arsenical pump membrane protein